MTIDRMNQVHPILTMNQALPLQQPFSAKKLYDALLHLGKGKFPRWDGLTAKFYLAFWDDIKQVLLAMINEAWCMPTSWKHGIVKLIPKQTLCEHLSDWRPITLMPYTS